MTVLHEHVTTNANHPLVQYQSTDQRKTTIIFKAHKQYDDEHDTITAQTTPLSRPQNKCPLYTLGVELPSQLKQKSSPAVTIVLLITELIV